MDLSHNSLHNVTDLDVVRAQRHVETSQTPDEFSPLPAFETSRHMQQIRFAGMVIRMAVTEPRDTTLHHDQPALIIKHGFMASRPAYDDLATELAATGRRVVHYGMPRTSTPNRHFHPRNIQDALRAHSQALNGVSQNLNRRFPDSPLQHDYIGHSLGGRALSKFIEYKPEAAHSAIFLASAGLKAHSFPQMIGRAVHSLTEEIIPYVKHGTIDKRFELATHSAYHALRNPLFLLREGYHAATDDAMPAIRHARSNGVKVASLWMTNDSFFPMHEVDDAITAEFDAWKIIHGNHLAPQEYARETASQVVSLLSSMERDAANSVLPTTSA